MSVCDKLRSREEKQMILYFSATGNCKYVATRLAQATGQEIHSIVDCIGSGLCAKKCPVQAIEMQGGRPVWIKEKCVMCLGCLHRCPKFAIRYGNRTKKHGQYTNPNVKV